MTGYPEIITDSSYKGHIVTMTNPLIGKYGVNLVGRGITGGCTRRVLSSANFLRWSAIGGRIFRSRNIWRKTAFPASKELTRAH